MGSVLEAPTERGGRQHKGSAGETKDGTSGVPGQAMAGTAAPLTGVHGIIAGNCFGCVPRGRPTAPAVGRRRLRPDWDGQAGAHTCPLCESGKNRRRPDPDGCRHRLRHGRPHMRPPVHGDAVTPGTHRNRRAWHSETRRTAALRRKSPCRTTVVPSMESKTAHVGLSTPAPQDQRDSPVLGGTGRWPLGDGPTDPIRVTRAAQAFARAELPVFDVDHLESARVHASAIVNPPDIGQASCAGWNRHNGSAMAWPRTEATPTTWSTNRSFLGQ